MFGRKATPWCLGARVALSLVVALLFIPQNTSMVAGAVADCGTPEDLGTYFRVECAYGTLAAHRLDVYYPRHATNTPVLFFVHGGGWAGGNKRGEYVHVPEPYVKDGLVVVSINYRLRPYNANRFPLCHHTTPIATRDEMEFMFDTARAFAWVRAHIAAYGGNSNHIVTMGHSAGGHIVSLLTADPTWLRDALNEAGQLTPEQYAHFRVSDFVAATINVSGPTNLNLDNPGQPWPITQGVLPGSGWPNACLNELVRSAFTPQMQLEASPIYQFWKRAEKESPPLLFIAGAGACRWCFIKDFADPPLFTIAHRDFVVYARSHGVHATFIQPLITEVYNWGLFGGYKRCYTYDTHGGTINDLSGIGAMFHDNQKYFEEKPNTCNMLSLANRWGTNADYKQAVAQFIRAPTAPLNWASPTFSSKSIPDMTPSALRINLAGGTFPATGGAWRSAEPITDSLAVPDLPGYNAHITGSRWVTNATIDLTGVVDGNGNTPPPGIFQHQAVPLTGTSFDLTAPGIPPGKYTLRVYFAVPSNHYLMDIVAEGVTLAKGIRAWGGAAWKARVVEYRGVTVDTTLNMTFRRASGASAGPMVAAVELVPVK